MNMENYPVTASVYAAGADQSETRHDRSLLQIFRQCGYTAMEIFINGIKEDPQQAATGQRVMAPEDCGA